MPLRTLSLYFAINRDNLTLITRYIRRLRLRGRTASVISGPQGIVRILPGPFFHIYDCPRSRADFRLPRASIFLSPVLRPKAAKLNSLVERIFIELREAARPSSYRSFIYLFAIYSSIKHRGSSIERTSAMTSTSSRCARGRSLRNLFAKLIIINKNL